MITPVLFIKKLEKKLCFCMNYRGLNIIIIKNHYSLSLIFKTLNHLNHAKIFIKLNIISAFNKFQIKKRNKILTIFHIHFNFFKYLIILFSLCNRSASFQKYINNIFQKYLNKFCTVYLNDILIYSNNKTEHKIYIKHIL